MRVRIIEPGDEVVCEVRCKGVTKGVFLGIIRDLKIASPRPRVAIKNPDPLTFAATALHTLRVVFENHELKLLGGYATKKAVDLIFDVAKARLTASPKREHMQLIEIYGPDNKRVTRKG